MLLTEPTITLNVHGRFFPTLVFGGQHRFASELGLAMSHQSHAKANHYIQVILGKFRRMVAMA
jgi:hypothetical protein